MAASPTSDPLAPRQQKRICILVPRKGMFDEAVENLTKAGHQITSLDCSDSGNASALPLPTYPHLNICAPHYIRRPYEAYLWLKDNPFDVVLYADEGGFGHFISMAKHQGLAFEGTLLCAKSFGSILERQEQNEAFPGSINDLGLDFMERMSRDHADIVLKPGQNILDALQVPKKAAVPVVFTKETAPLVSICICHHDRSQFLKQALSSIEALDYPNYEVVLVDDGSITAEAKAYLNDLAPVFKQRNWHLIRQNNQWQGAATNNAVRRARGKYIKLMDDDNIARPHELSTFVRIAEKTGADILTCIFDTFHGASPPKEDQNADARYLFIGPAVDVGSVYNGFGDNNALIRREVFQKLGGFDEAYGRGYTDWEFFARAALKGYHLEVVPEPLFWCRKTGTNMLDTTDTYQNALLSLQPYKAALPPELRPMLLYLRGIAGGKA